MRFPLPIKPGTPSRQLASPSRLIPGAQASISGVPRKKSSATVDGRFWEWPVPEGFGEPKKRRLSEVLAEVLLPSPLVHGQRWNLARQVSADFVLIILTFVAVHHLTGLLKFAIHHDSGDLLRAEPVLTAGLGLVLLY